MLIIIILSVLSCNLQSLSSTFEGYLQAGLVLLNPLMDIATDGPELDSTRNQLGVWVLAQTSRKVGTRQLPDGAGIVRVQYLGQTGIPVSLPRHWQGAQ